MAKKTAWGTLRRKCQMRNPIGEVQSAAEDSRLKFRRKVKVRGINLRVTSTQMGFKSLSPAEITQGKTHRGKFLKYMRQAVCIKAYFQACGGNSSVGFDSDRGAPGSDRVEARMRACRDGHAHPEEGRHLQCHHSSLACKRIMESLKGFWPSTFPPFEMYPKETTRDSQNDWCERGLSQHCL